MINHHASTTENYLPAKTIIRRLGWFRR